MEDGEALNPTLEETIAEDGLSVELHKRHLFHGSAAGGISAFNMANDPTIGGGVYLTSTKDAALRYSNVRSQQMETKPVVYEVEVDGLELVDLRKDENVGKIMSGFRAALEERSKEEKWDHFYRNRIRMSISEIDAGKVKPGTVKLAVHGHNDFFSDYLRSLGYDGLVGYEGDEENRNLSNDSYVIFDSSKIKIVREEQVN